MIKRTLGLFVAASLIVSFCGLAVADTGTVEAVDKGVVFMELYVDDGPWAVKVIDIDLKKADVTFGVSLGGEYIMGIEPLDMMIKRVMSGGRRVIAGINGDFYHLAAGAFQGDPTGFCVIDGDMVSTPINRSALVILRNGVIGIGRFSFEGSLSRGSEHKYSLDGVNRECTENGIVILTPSFNYESRPQEDSVALLVSGIDSLLAPESRHRFTVLEKVDGDSPVAIPPHRALLIGRGEGGEFLDEFKSGDRINCELSMTPSPGDVLHAVGGIPRIVREGEVSIEAVKERVGKKFVDARHPRTAVGFGDGHAYLVTVDGRQEGYSAGMNLHELADFMKNLGAEDAVNLDGGGSTTMWVDGEVRNKPSDGRVRSIGNALLIYGR